MLIAMYGMFATGKTYALDHNRDQIAGALYPGHKLTIVHADIKTLYNYKRKRNSWERLIGSRDTWKGEQTGKTAILDEMIRDLERVWIVESARFFGGMYDLILQSYNKAPAGGLAFIIPTVLEDDGLLFLQERAQYRNKEFRADYWDGKRLKYECYDRYMNAMKAHYIPAGVPVYQYYIDYHRTAWEEVISKVCEMVGWDGAKWYGYSRIQSAKKEPTNERKISTSKRHAAKSSADQGQQRLGQEHDSTPAAGQVVRHPLTKRFW